MEKRLLVATHNVGKVAELGRMLGEMDVQWVNLADVGVTAEVEETGQSFRENAIVKAEYYAKLVGMVTLADDSGLEVDALDGLPGVMTSRYSQMYASYGNAYSWLLDRLEGVASAERTARFRCVMALATAEELVGTAEGACEGVIAVEAAGERGFGYDPVFYVPEMGRTMAQLTPLEKQSLSHRGRAFMAILPLLKRNLRRINAGK